MGLRVVVAPSFAADFVPFADICAFSAGQFRPEIRFTTPIQEGPTHL